MTRCRQGARLTRNGARHDNYPVGSRSLCRGVLSFAVFPLQLGSGRELPTYPPTLWCFVVHLGVCHLTYMRDSQFTKYWRWICQLPMMRIYYFQSLYFSDNPVRSLLTTSIMSSSLVEQPLWLSLSLPTTRLSLSYSWFTIHTMIQPSPPRFITNAFCHYWLSSPLPLAVSTITILVNHYCYCYYCPHWLSSIVINYHYNCRLTHWCINSLSATTVIRDQQLSCHYH